MAFQPNSAIPRTLPRFKAKDKGLEDALNTLAKAIEEIRIPDVRFLVDGTTEWNGDSVMVKPDLRREPNVKVFWPTLYYGDGAFYVTCSNGQVCVIDKVPTSTSTDVIEYIECPSRIDANGNLTKFTIAENQCLYVVVREKNSGKVGVHDGSVDEPVDMFVLPDGQISINYYPPVLADPPNPEVDGVYYYKIAKLVIENGVPKLDMFLAGGHIYHTCGLTGDLLLEDCSGDPYADPVEDGVLIARLSFVSGLLVAVNKTVSERPLSINTAREQIEPCSYVP